MQGDELAMMLVMNSPLKSMLQLFVGVILLMNLTACGTLMHPERKGQRGGDIDAGIAILDGIGLLFFLIPGIIAFAVDFSNGTIYLPGGYHHRHSALDIHDMTVLRFDPKHTTRADIERMIKETTGITVHLDDKKAKVSKLESLDEMLARFNEVRAERLAKIPD